MGSTSHTAQKDEIFVLPDDYFKNTCKKLPNWTPYTITDMPSYYVNQCDFYCVLLGKVISSPFRIPDNYSCDINKICLNGKCINSPSRSGVEYCRSLFPNRRITAIRAEKSCMIECFDLDTLEILLAFHTTSIPEPCDYDDN
ncbi:uncharacterized protein [Centruroides vittatus]|uniref:uncharacterized protein n=1 Tax=Centruroides vittatus TaxID=120091 RepID=UPI003510001A